MRCCVELRCPLGPVVRAPLRVITEARFESSRYPLDMASDFVKITNHVGRVMREAADAAGVFDNPTGKGDGREDLVRHLLRERVGTSFGVDKAEIIDSYGESSREVDVVVFDQSVAASLHVMGQRRIVRVEAVAINIEVKTTFNRAAVDQTKEAVERLEGLRRIYEPSELMRVLQPTHPDLPEADNRAFGEGIRSTEILACDMPKATLVPQVVNCIFAYGGQGEDAALDALISTNLIDMVFVLGKYVVAREAAFYETGEGTLSVVRAEGAGAMAAFLTLVERSLQKYRSSRTWVVPSFHRYYRRSAAPAQ